MKQHTIDSIVAELKKLTDPTESSEESAKPISLSDDEDLNAIILAVNALIESRRDQEKQDVKYQSSRMESIQEVLNAYLSRDFSPRTKISERRDHWDAMALAINYFGSELEASFKRTDDFAQLLEDRIAERTQDLETTKEELLISLEKEKELNKLKGQFVSNASHQFRTPLTVIEANVGLLRLLTDSYTEEKKPKLEKACKRITEEVTNMTNMMNDVLMLGKIEVDANYKLKLKKVDLELLCNNLANMFNEIQADNRKLSISTKGKPYLVELDNTLIQEALTNIVCNAFKYSKGKKSPELTIQFDEDSVNILIKDYGIGIPETTLEDIYQPFSRADNASPFKGSGLGLSISKNIITLHGGQLHVDSEINEGTTFSVVLPNRHPEEEETAW